MISNFLHKKDSKDKRKSKMEANPSESLTAQILDIRQQLTKYINQTTQNFLVFNDRVNNLQTEVESLLTQTSEIDGVDVEGFRKMETKIADMSEEITKLNEAVYVNIKECLVDILNMIQKQKTAS